MAQLGGASSGGGGGGGVGGGESRAASLERLAEEARTAALAVFDQARSPTGGASAIGRYVAERADCGGNAVYNPFAYADKPLYAPPAPQVPPPRVPSSPLLPQGDSSPRGAAPAPPRTPPAAGAKAECSGGEKEEEEEGELDLMYDPVLDCYYDPKTNKYYELRDP